MKLKIEKYDDFGRGIGFLNNKITFVPNTVVGDLVLVDIVKEKSRYNVGKMRQIIEPSIDRIQAHCPYFTICGGCVYQNITYQNSVKIKKEMVKNYFQKEGLVINPEIVLNPNPNHYRNKITLKIKDGQLGYFKSDSHELVKIDMCSLAKESINEVIRIVNNLGVSNGEIILRSNYQDQILVIIKTKETIKNKYLNLNKNIIGIVVNDKLVMGQDYFLESVNDFKYKVSYNSFFQVNLAVAQKMFNLVKEYINEKDIVLDLYSGVGTFSLTSSGAKTVYGVEIVQNAVLNARENAVNNNVFNTHFILSDAKDVLKFNQYFNKLILDPPRAGVSNEVIEFIKAKKPEMIIYVSCDYHTQARDIKLLENDYTIIKSYICDMFSYTYHVECVILLQRKD